MMTCISSERDVKAIFCIACGEPSLLPYITYHPTLLLHCTSLVNFRREVESEDRDGEVGNKKIATKKNGELYSVDSRMR